MIRSWVITGAIAVATFGAAARPGVSAGRESRVVADTVEKGGAITPRQREWLRATPDQRVRLSEMLGEKGARALAKQNGYEAICDGLDRTLPQGPDQVYRTADGRVVVYEAKGGSSPLGHAYGHQQGTSEWAVESSKRVKSAKAGPAEKTAAREILIAAAEHRLTVEVVRTKHRLGEPFVAVVEQSLSATDDAAKLAKAALNGMARPAATAGRVARTATRSKLGRAAGKAILPVALIVDGACRVNDSEVTERRFASGEITQQEREIEHTKNTAGMVGGWGGAWAGAEVGAATGGAVGTAIAPGPGTAIGAAVGGAAGGVTGYFAGEAAAVQAAEWAVGKVHGAGSTLKGAWNWAFGR